jgi:hypothetical protein
MDHGTGHLGQDLKDIVQTREAMAHKLELLEQRVQDTVHAAKSTVSEVVEKIAETAGNVRGQAESFVAKTTQALNPSEQMKEHPWLFVAGAVLLGLALGRRQARRTAGNSESFGGSRARVIFDDDHPRRESRRHPRETIGDALAAQIRDEIADLQTVIVQTGRMFIHDIVTKVVLPALTEPLKSGLLTEHRIRPPRGRHSL